ncbi:MAG TPA: LPS assembly lipoprotein LptE [Pararhizobium sp.]|nr:LPS assembly lipoprotein LptE [Pararhizobium sp.]
MSLSEGGVRRRLLLSAALLTAGLALGGCQVRPMYADSSPARQKLMSVAVEPVSSRVAQQVRNQLIFLFYGGGMAPSESAYDLALNVRRAAIGVFVNSATNTATAGNMRVTVNYVLKDAKTQAVVKKGTRTAVAAYDQPSQEFAKIRSARDAENRAARAAADLVDQDIAGFLSR